MDFYTTYLSTINGLNKEPYKKDSTYEFVKNPQKANTQRAKIFAESFNINYPDWEKDEYLVHRLKQDTPKARLQGKIPSDPFATELPEWLKIMFGLTGIGFFMSILLKDISGKEIIPKSSKALCLAFVVIISTCIVDSIKYIKTGQRLFEKNQKIKKGNENEFHSNSIVQSK